MTRRYVRRKGNRKIVKIARSVARREIKSLSESKRVAIVNEGWNNGSTPAGFSGLSTYIVNAFSALGPAVTDEGFMGNEIIDPLLVLRGAIEINWSALATAANATPTVAIDIYLIAVNDDTSIVNPRSTTTGEDAALWIRYPDGRFTSQMNTQNVTVLKKKKMRFSPRNLVPVQAGSTFYAQLETRNFKMVKRLRGKKQFETAVQNVGQPVAVPQTWLKGWNFYYVITRSTNTAWSSATVVSPVRTFVDRYVYFKDP